MLRSIGTDRSDCADLRPRNSLGTRAVGRSPAVRRIVLVAFVLVIWTARSITAVQGIEAQLHTQPVPSDIPAPVGTALAAGGVRAVAGGVTLDFWWVKSMDVGATPPAWASVEEGTLVGAVRLDGDFRDIRGRIIKAGVYTLRYGVQPDNGDHLGTSPFRDFLLLVPAALDTAVPARGHDDTVDLSKRAIGGSHPAVWSIDPPATTQPVLSKHTTDLGHSAIVVEVPCAQDGRPAGPLRFGIVLIGRIEA